MTDYLLFLAHHWLLVSLFVIAVAVLFYEEARGRLHGGLTPQDAVRFTNKDRGIILDFRSKEEYQSGHILGAMLAVPERIEEYLAAQKIEQTQPLLLVCRDGHRSQSLKEVVQKLGYTDVSILRGGIHAWKHENYPLTRA